VPLVRIDLTDQMPDSQVAGISQAVHDALVQTFKIPPRDKFQIITKHPVGQIIAQDAGLGFERKPGVVVLQIFTQKGRTAAIKQQLYKAISDGLAAVGVGGTELFLGYQENGPEDWSFAYGEAQYLTGKLSVPEI
jgi:Tautomerase enzyme